ncbi:MAG: hypothetical protein FWC89_01825 [Defluviitaleaceae bacterium]|nr:hypothetical protein [Defluviitaleaceae bacterium]
MSKPKKAAQPHFADNMHQQAVYTSRSQIPFPKSKKACGGLTLLEVVIAFALWIILSIGVFMVWQHSARAGTVLLERQDAFESARVAMDALIMNMQMARQITLQTDSNDILIQLSLIQNTDPSTNQEAYRFNFNVNASYGTANHNRLRFGDNEFASGIAEIRIYPVDNRMRIIVTTACPEPIILEGSVDIRYKQVTIIGGSS